MENLLQQQKPLLKLRNSVKRPSRQNMLRKYIRITDSDCYIAEYVDFLTFYGSYLPDTMVIWCRDNDCWANYFGFHISRWKEWTGVKNIILKVQYYYEGKIVDIAQLNEFTAKWWDRFLRVQVYGKGLLIINRVNLWDEFENLLFFFGMSDITLTRIDYAIDCEKMNFNKKNYLNAKKWWQFHNVRTWELEYLWFGSKGKSPLFLRYYNKKKDLKDSNFEWLYPEYEQYETVMRYELQVNSDWISANGKYQHIYDLKGIVNFWKQVSKSKRSHKKYTAADKDFKTVQDIILNYKKTGNKWQISRILMLLESCVL